METGVNVYERRRHAQSAPPMAAQAILIVIGPHLSVDSHSFRKIPTVLGIVFPKSVRLEVFRV